MSGDLVGQGQEAAKAVARTGGGLTEFLSRFLDTWVYIEGARMNLKEVFTSSYGHTSAIVLDPCLRIGDWGRGGPDPQYEMCMTGPCVVTWDSILEMGAMPANWTTPSRGPGSGSGAGP